jgi:RIO-like serine/threonine protein kinase
MHAITLENLGIAVAPPVAFIQEYLGTGLKGRSWYLSESVDGENCLNHLPTINDETVQAQILEQIIDTLKKIWARHITHGDLKGSNILLPQDQAVLLDLDAMKQHEDEEAARRHIGKDVERFLLNWKKDHPHPALYELTRRKLSEAGFSEQ